jgi:hypothetical protein
MKNKYTLVELLIVIFAGLFGITVFAIVACVLKFLFSYLFS